MDAARDPSACTTLSRRPHGDASHRHPCREYARPLLSRVVLLHHRLSGYTSHHFNESRGFALELPRRGRELVVLVHRGAERRIVRELRARAVLEDPTFRTEWSFKERSARFVEMLHAQAGRLVKRGDVVLITIATQLEAHALTVWLQQLPERGKPFVVVYFISDRWNRADAAERARQVAEFAKVAAVIRSNRDANKIIYGAITDALAGELRELLGTPVHVAPMPQHYGDSRPPRRVSSIPRVGILGGLRREKGSHRIPEIIRATRAQVNVEFLVHLTNNNLTAEEVAHVGRIRQEPGVTVIEDALPLPEYEAAFDTIDFGLFPYEPVAYRQRTSGVFAEMVVQGRPVVVTPGTWMAAQVESGRAAGVISEDLQPESIARAIAHCAANRDSLRQAAQALSAEFRRTTSLPAFVDRMEEWLAERALQEPPPPRRRFPWFR